MIAFKNHAAAAFSTEDDEVVVGGVRLSALAVRVGQTPFYVYDRRLIDERIARVRTLLPRTVKLHYAMKANPMPDVVQHIAAQVDGLDVASAGELAVALDSGIAAQDISFAGPGKRQSELADAARAGILVNIESFREVRLLDAIARETDREIRVAVRVNPDFELKSSGMRMGGGPKQFGIDAERVPDALAEIRASRLRFEGFHIFSGSQNLSHAAIAEAQMKAVELAGRLSAAAPGPVTTVNIGGGFGIPYFPGEKPLDLARVGEHMNEVVRVASRTLPGADVVIELGRFLIGEAGIYVCRVIDRKVSRGEVFLVTDGGLHHHLAASGNFGQVLRKNYPVAIGNRVTGERREIASVVGPLCTPLDLLADRMDLAEAREGDLVAVFQSGAYGMTASPHGFLSHPPPAELLV